MLYPFMTHLQVLNHSLNFNLNLNLNLTSTSTFTLANRKSLALVSLSTNISEIRIPKFEIRNETHPWF
jgi:hypothetical protein